MSFPRYPQYKESGVDWLPPVPAHWNVTKLRHCVKSIYSGGTPESGEERFWTDGEEGIPWVAIGDMTREPMVTRTDRCVSEAGLLSKGLRVLPSGTLLYSMYASIGKVAVLGIDATINQAILGIAPAADTLSGDFLRYWLIQLEGHLALFSSSNTQDNLNAAKVRSFPVFTPPREDQSVIVRFLDRETAKIDALIAEQQRLMDLLQQKRQAVITHAVTKGLNPDATMKPSGVEWLGDVPESWAMERLQRVCSFLSGKAHEPYFNEDGEYICVTSRFISTEGVKMKMCSANLCPARPNDTLMVMSDLPNGRALAKAFYVVDNRAYAVNQRVCILRPHSVVPKFLYYLLDRNTELLRHDDGANQTHLSNSDFLKPRFPFPPLDEQLIIVRYLDAQLSSCDMLLEQSEQAIDLLHERRAALISAAVTGAIDVRGSARESVA